jgi:hypothetical protein
LFLMATASASASMQVFTERTIKGQFNGAYSVYAADVDGDGDVDALGAAQEDSDITWWENDGSNPPIFIEHTIDGAFGGACSVYATDLDDDGDTDVLGAASGDHDIACWENNGATLPSFSKHVIDPEVMGASSVHCADFDGDGDNDVLGASYALEYVSWWENRLGEATPWVEHAIAGEDQVGCPDSVYAADVDGDGDNDALAASACSDDVAWWENRLDEASPWVWHVVDDTFDLARTVYATDVDGDGDMDILAASQGDSRIAWWENDGGENFTKHIVVIGFSHARSVYASDVDGDGDVDILGGAPGLRQISWWENTGGTPPVFAQHIVSGRSGPHSIYATDLDGDGDTDILAGDYENQLWLDNELAWWENLQDFSISSSPPRREVVAAQSAGYELSLSSMNGFVREVSLSVDGLPEGTSAIFAPSVGVPPFTAAMTVTTEPITPAGAYELDVIGAAGVLTHAVTVDLGVSSFAISGAPCSQLLMPGSTVSYTIALTSLNGFDQPVALAAEGLPPGCLAAFSTNPILPTADCTMTVDGGLGPLASSQVLEIVGTSELLTRSTTVRLDPPYREVLPFGAKDYAW